MRAKWFAALPMAAMLLAGGTATAQTTTTPAGTPAQADTAASKPASSQGQTAGESGQGAAQEPGTISAAPPATDQTTVGNPTVKSGRDARRTEVERDARRVNDLIRAGYMARNYYPGQSTYLPLFQRDPQYSALARPIDVTLDHASVRQTAQALTKASGLTVGVDKAVPEDIRLTVDARGVPMATVLEAIANQAKLLIAPARPDKSASSLQYQAANQPNALAVTVMTSPGIVLKLSPSLKIGDHPAVEFPSPTAPWSDEWFLKPEHPYTASVLRMDGDVASFGQGTPDFNAGSGGFGGDYGRWFGGSTAFAGSAVGGSGSFSIAAIGDRELVVAEPAGYGGPGVLLTVYRLENGQLRKVSTFVHRFVSEEPRTQRTPRRQASGGATPVPSAGAAKPLTPPDSRGNVSPVPVEGDTVTSPAAPEPQAP